MTCNSRVAGIRSEVRSMQVDSKVVVSSQLLLMVLYGVIQSDCDTDGDVLMVNTPFI